MGLELILVPAVGIAIASVTWITRALWAVIVLLVRLLRWLIGRQWHNKIRERIPSVQVADTLAGMGWDSSRALLAVSLEKRRREAVAALVSDGWDKVEARRIVANMLKGK